MIRQLTKQDRTIVQSYLAKEPVWTLYFVYNIDNYGFDSDFCQFWVDIDDTTYSIKSIINLFYNSLSVYSQDSRIDHRAIVDFLKENDIPFEVVNGKEDMIGPFQEVMTFGNVHRCHFAELRRDNFRPAIDDNFRFEQARPKDAESVYGLLKQIDEFREMLLPIEHMKDQLEAESGITYCVRDKKKIVATACVTAMTDQVARIGYVCTLPAYRNRGYASQLVSALSRDMLAQDVTCTLGYSNPAAGRIYNSVGYTEIGQTLILVR